MSKKRIIVIGAGAWGGWSAYMLQKAGYKVTLVDQYGPGNERSGSGGRTRIIRLAYGGNPDYTRMTHRSFQLWEEHERLWNEKLYHETGAIWLFNNVSDAYASLSKPMMDELGYPLEEMEIDKVRSKYPQFFLDDITKAYWEPKCGYLEAARSCEVVVDQFQKLGGVFLKARITKVEGNGYIDSLITESGEKLKADQYVFACGPWITNLFPGLEGLIYTSRQEVYYYKAPEKHLAQDLPIWLEFSPPDYMRYGIPDHFNSGFKVAYDERDESLDPDRDDREVTPDKLKEITDAIVHRFPALNGTEMIEHKVCVYENSKDGEFIMDQTPGFSNGILLGGSSGHGFKMGPAIGEMVKDKIASGIGFPGAFKLERLYTQERVRNQYKVD